MADQTAQLAPPDGYTPAPTATSAQLAPPPGYVSAPVQKDASPPPTTTAPELSWADKAANQMAAGASDIATGVGKGILDTTSGIGSLIQKIPVIGPKIIPQQGLAAEEKVAKIDPNAPGAVGQYVGKGMENIGEFAAGEEGLKGIASVMKIATHAPDVMTLLEKYPTSAKIILGALKSGTVGASQGAVKGAASKEGAVAGAEAGGLGGALGGAAAEGASAFLGQFIKSPVDALEKAAGGSRGVNEKFFKENVQSVLPNIVEENRITSIRNETDLANAAHSAKNKVWDAYKAMTDINAHPNEFISGDDIAQKIKDSVDPNLRAHFASKAKMIDKWADTFKGDIPLNEAPAKVSYLNSHLKDFYKGSPGEQFAQAQRNPELGMLDSAADAVRNSLDAKLTSLGETGAADLRKQYGALNQIQRVFEKRAIVYGRQAPMSLGQQVGNIAAVSTGHAAPVAIAAAGKHLNSPGHLIRSALSQADPGAIRTVVNAIGTVAPTVAGAAGAGAGGEWVRMMHPMGQHVEVHPDDVSEAETRGMVQVPAQGQ